MAVKAPGPVRIWLAGALLAVGGFPLCAGCDYGEVVVVPPAAAGHGPLTLTVVADPEDTATARELGWSAGIPGAEVTVSPGNLDTATGPPVAVVLTDGAGTATVPDLPDGSYLVGVRRLLTASEMSGLPAGEDVVGFMASQVVTRGRATVPTPASHRRSIVISEWAFNGEWIPDVGVSYYFGGFLELYNNADTTVYLDGLVIGQAFALADELSTIHCATYEFLTNDPDGVWARYFDSVPGTGHSHPLAPGQTAVLATDAIDHAAVVPGGLDLSHADFEWIGTADPDNPSVPNLVDIGVAPWPYFGHGPLFATWGNSVLFVGLPVEVGTLPGVIMPGTEGQLFRRVPRIRILEAVALRSRYSFGTPFCPHLVHTNFDRHPAPMLELSYKVVDVVSAHRKVAYTRADGRRILQHTHSAITDFYRGARTPALVP